MTTKKPQHQVSEGLFWDMDGKPITDVLAYAKLYEDFDKRCLADQQVETCRVVTVWTGTDQDTLGNLIEDEHVPLIFSSAVFLRPDKKRRHVGNAIREIHAATKEGALANHDQLVAWVRTTRKASLPAR